MQTVTNWIEEAIDATSATLNAKGKDYALDTDQFSAFRSLTDWYGTEPYWTALGEVVKKLERLKALKTNGRAPTNESVEDTMKDIAGYAILAYAMYLERVTNDASKLVKHHEAVWPTEVLGASTNQLSLDLEPSPALDAIEKVRSLRSSWFVNQNFGYDNGGPFKLDPIDGHKVQLCGSGPHKWGGMLYWCTKPASHTSRHGHLNGSMTGVAW